MGVVTTRHACTKPLIPASVSIESNLLGPPLNVEKHGWEEQRDIVITLVMENAELYQFASFG